VELYSAFKGEYDVAGFCVGVVEKKSILTGKDIRPGDALIGLASNGLHSNGYSLARKVLLEDRKFPFDKPVPSSEQTLGEALLAPTRIYVKTFLRMMEKVKVKGGAHITGGGLVENVPRILPQGLGASIDPNAWVVPPIFRLISEAGNISPQDMFRTFNMGIGMVVVVPKEEAEEAVRVAQDCGETAMVIGQVIESGQGVVWAGGIE